jgi:hypothetical protein
MLILQRLLTLILITATGFIVTACNSSNGSGESAAYVAPAEPFPHFGNSLSYAVLSSRNFTNSGLSTIYGDIGVNSTSTLTGLSSITRTGGLNHMNDSSASIALADAGVAYTNIQNAHCDTDLTGQNLGGKTLTPGTYCFSGDANLSGLLTLDAQGSNRANFVFQVAGSLVTQVDAGVRMISNGESCNVFWQVLNTVNFASNTNFIGGIIAMGNINFDNNSRLNGKIMSRNGTIAIDQSEIYNNFCPWW